MKKLVISAIGKDRTRHRQRGVQGHLRQRLQHRGQPHERARRRARAGGARPRQLSAVAKPSQVPIGRRSPTSPLPSSTPRHVRLKPIWCRTSWTWCPWISPASCTTSPSSSPAARSYRGNHHLTYLGGAHRHRQCFNQHDRERPGQRADRQAARGFHELLAMNSTLTPRWNRHGVGYSAP